MINNSLSAVLLIFGALLLAGCNSAESKRKAAAQRSQPQSVQVDTTYADGIRRITIQELQDLRTKGNVFVVDVRNQAAYDQGHVPGAVLIPSDQVASRIKDFPRDRQIITYCS